MLSFLSSRNASSRAVGVALAPVLVPVFFVAVVVLFLVVVLLVVAFDALFAVGDVLFFTDAAGALARAEVIA